eukprot:5821332-Pyramimonas_sp.AAC.1
MISAPTMRSASPLSRSTSYRRSIRRRSTAIRRSLSAAYSGSSRRNLVDAFALRVVVADPGPQVAHELVPSVSFMKCVYQ